MIKGSRQLYNIHRITKDIEANERPLNHTIKNLDIKCLRCSHPQTIPIKTAFNCGVSCPKCGNKVKANPLIMNYRMNRTPIIDNTSKETYQIGGFRIRG